MQFSTDESERMIGFSLKVSELKQQLSRKIIREARRLEDSESTDYLRSTLAGGAVSYSSDVAPWWCPGNLREVVEERGDGGAIVLHSGGYPLLLIAPGSTIIEEIAEVEGSRQEELKAVLNPETLYLVEAWDQS